MFLDFHLLFLAIFLHEIVYVLRKLKKRGRHHKQPCHQGLDAWVWPYLIVGVNFSDNRSSLFRLVKEVWTTYKFVCSEHKVGLRTRFKRQLYLAQQFWNAVGCLRWKFLTLKLIYRSPSHIVHNIKRRAESLRRTDLNILIACLTSSLNLTHILNICLTSSPADVVNKWNTTWQVIDRLSLIQSTHIQRQIPDKQFRAHREKILLRPMYHQHNQPKSYLHQFQVENDV